MALSKKTKEIVIVALADKKAGQELAAAVDAGNSQAASVAAIGSQTPAVDQTTTNANIAAVAAKVDAVIAALKAAKLMA